MLQQEVESQGPPLAHQEVRNHLQSDSDGVLVIKNDRMYSHRILRINYTTYDIRRAQDVINPGTTHHNIMLLAEQGLTTAGSLEHHPFLYARVLGVYHVNVVYVGSGMLDYRARRLDFLWVWWYQRLATQDTMGWKACHLDQLFFPPM